jgi:membrane-associated protein
LRDGIGAAVFLPGNPLIFIGGAFCAKGQMNIWLLMAIPFSAALTGSAHPAND